MYVFRGFALIIDTQSMRKNQTKLEHFHFKKILSEDALGANCLTVETKKLEKKY